MNKSLKTFSCQTFSVMKRINFSWINIKTMYFNYLPIVVKKNISNILIYTIILYWICVKKLSSFCTFPQSHMVIWKLAFFINMHVFKCKLDFSLVIATDRTDRKRHPNWSNTIPILWRWLTNIVANLMAQEGFDWSSGWLIIKLQSIFGWSFISPLNNSVPGCLRCMARHTAMAKHIFTLQSLLSMMMLPLFAIQ